MDNRIFNVNGRGADMLLQTLRLAFMQEGDRTTCKSWAQTQEHGLLLLWCKGQGDSDLPCEMTAGQIAPMVEQWLAGEFAKTVQLGDWCGNIDHDGHNELGWQVYYERVSFYEICTVRPAYLHYGK